MEAVMAEPVTERDAAKIRGRCRTSPEWSGTIPQIGYADAMCADP